MRIFNNIIIRLLRIAVTKATGYIYIYIKSGKRKLQYTNVKYECSASDVKMLKIRAVSRPTNRNNYEFCWE